MSARSMQHGDCSGGRELGGAVINFWPGEVREELTEITVATLSFER